MIRIRRDHGYEYIVIFQVGTCVKDSYYYCDFIIKKFTNNTCWRGCGEKGTLLHCWWECKLVQPLWRTVWRFLKKLKIELPYDPGIPLLGIYPEKTIIRKDICTPMFTAALFAISKTWKQPNKSPSTEKWIVQCLVSVYLSLVKIKYSVCV